MDIFYPVCSVCGYSVDECASHKGKIYCFDCVEVISEIDSVCDALSDDDLFDPLPF